MVATAALMQKKKKYIQSRARLPNTDELQRTEARAVCRRSCRGRRSRSSRRRRSRATCLLHCCEMCLWATYVRLVWVFYFFKSSLPIPRHVVLSNYRHFRLFAAVVFDRVCWQLVFGTFLFGANTVRGRGGRNDHELQTSTGFTSDSRGTLPMNVDELSWGSRERFRGNWQQNKWLTRWPDTQRESSSIYMKTRLVFGF